MLQKPEVFPVWQLYYLTITQVLTLQTLMPRCSKAASNFGSISSGPGWSEQCAGSDTGPLWALRKSAGAIVPSTLCQHLAICLRGFCSTELQIALCLLVSHRNIANFCLNSCNVWHLQYSVAVIIHQLLSPLISALSISSPDWRALLH